MNKTKVEKLFNENGITLKEDELQGYYVVKTKTDFTFLIGRNIDNMEKKDVEFIIDTLQTF